MTTDRAFLRPRLFGPRFDGHSIPLEVLKDLAVLEEMIIEVAKTEFLKDHPNRQRTPRGFTEGVELKLTGIEDGSAIPIISLFVATAALFPPENQLYFERGRDAIVRAISAAEQNQLITEHLPEKTLGYFDRLGRSLRQGEGIEFCTAGNSISAHLTRETRRKLLLASSQIDELSEETLVRGAIPEADQDDMTFELQLLDGRKVKAPLTPQHLETTLEAFSGYKSGTRVLLQGVGRVNRSGKLVGFETVDHISLLDPLDVVARLEELRSLRDGWLEGRGVAPPSHGIDWLTEAFARNFPDELKLPFVYPTEDGGIRLEWSLPPKDVSLDIDVVAQRAEWHVLDMRTDAEFEEGIDLSREEDWRWVAEQLRSMAGEDA